MSPPDAPPPRRGTGANGQIERDSRISNQSTATLTPTSSTAEFVRGRERVLGRRVWLHDEPVIAAKQLVEARGPLSARAWVRELLAELEVA